MKNRTSKVSIILATLILALASIAGCTDAKVNQEGSIKLVGIKDEVIEISLKDIYDMEPIKEVYITISSDGEEIEVEIKGVSLNSIIAQYDLSLDDFDEIRGVADDGYAVAIPNEILADKDIILIYEYDGKQIHEDKGPLRMAINGERKLYWVSNLIELQFIIAQEDMNEAIQEASQIVFINEACSELKQHEITYYESTDSGVTVEDIIDTYASNAINSVKILSTDGFEKVETLDNLLTGFIKTTGENAPMFISGELSKGAYIKSILFMELGQVILANEAGIIKLYDTTIVDEYSSVLLSDILEATGIAADKYLIAASDGYSVEISSSDIDKGYLAARDDGTYQVMFTEDMLSDTKVKNVLSITAIDDATTMETETDEKIVLPEWTIIVEGLPDGIFDLTSERAQRKLEMASIEVEKEQNSEIVVQAWQGYRLIDVLSFLKVDSYSTIEVVASDGYSLELNNADIDENILLGVIKDEEILVDKSNLVQLVGARLPSSNWIKGVAKIIIK